MDAVQEEGVDIEEVSPNGAAKGESKASSLTEEFKVHLQSGMNKILGQKISKETAWLLFKYSVVSAFSFILKRPGDEKKLPLSGVGVFEVLQAKPRTPEEEKLGFNPRARFYPSSAIQRKVEEFYGLVEPRPEAERAPKAAKAKPERAPKAAKPKASKDDESDELDADLAALALDDDSPDELKGLDEIDLEDEI